MRVNITEPAAADLRKIEEYVSKDNIAASERLVKRLERLCFLLGDKPGIGRKRDYLKSGLRTIAEGNYLICYRIKQDSVEVLRIIHGARDIERIFAVIIGQED